MAAFSVEVFETATMKEAAHEFKMFLGFYSKRKQVIYKLHNLFVFTCNKYMANSEPNSQAQNNYPNSHERSTRVNRMHPELLMQINRSYAKHNTHETNETNESVSVSERTTPMLLATC
jgi:hypothetical protein